MELDPWQQLVNDINHKIALRTFDIVTLGTQFERDKILAFIDGAVKKEVEYLHLDSNEIERLYRDIYDYFDIPISWLKVWW